MAFPLSLPPAGRRCGPFMISAGSRRGGFGCVTVLSPSCHRMFTDPQPVRHGSWPPWLSADLSGRMR
ncbi:hypothetical protein [Sphingomonas prati]|uniref:hypothetical protein n=1 Tax=Sphingomonas prati TaxID=1843237 RepID=UPI0018DFE87D|nr:hypothetical protein [Sphingomonas prati]